MKPDIVTVGVDLAKNVFQVYAIGALTFTIPASAAGQDE